MQDFISRNWQILVWVVAAIFAAGGIHSEITAQRTRIDSIEERLDKKIIIIDRLESRVQEAETEAAYQRGKLDGRSAN